MEVSLASDISRLKKTLNHQQKSQLPFVISTTLTKMS